MRIIKMGNINKYTNTCPYCSCEYEYDDTDVSTGYNLTSTGNYSYVVCPCCGKLNTIYGYYNPQPYWQNPVIYSSNNQMTNDPLDLKANANHYPDIRCETVDEILWREEQNGQLDDKNGNSF